MKYKVAVQIAISCSKNLVHAYSYHLSIVSVTNFFKSAKKKLSTKMKDRVENSNTIKDKTKILFNIWRRKIQEIMELKTSEFDHWGYI